MISNYSTGAILHQYYYNFDVDGNRTSKQVDSNVTQETSNNLNQLTSVSAGGPTRFQGTVSQPSTVTVNGQPAMQATSTNFVANPPLSSGTNTVNVVATNGNNTSQTNSYQVIIPAQATVSPTYDSDGNMLNNGNGQTYAWDAENRLITITYTGGATSNFTYDAIGRRVSIIEKNSSGTVTTTKQFAFCGMTPCEERDSSGTNVTTRLYPQGEQISGTNYFYTRDHLGSIRELTTSSGTVATRLDFDPFGVATVVSGTLIPDLGYAGMFWHQPSGDNLTWGRLYEAPLGRWTTRDPIQEQGGLNMYAYCGNNPVDYRDRSGLNYHTYQYADPIGLPGHQYVSVDNPSGGAPITFSFDNPSFPSPTGPGKWSEGYDPSKHGYSSPTVNCYASTPAQDAALIKAFRAKIAAQADRYDFSSVSGYNCRTAEDDVIDNTLGSAAWTPDPPPPYVPLHLGANSGSGGFGM